MATVDVLVIGRSCLDHIAVVAAFPAEDTKTPALYRTTEAGGQGGTAACCISRLGWQVAYVGKLGDDPAGDFCRQRLADFAVDTRRVEIVPEGKTPQACIIVTRGAGRHTIVYEPSSAIYRSKRSPAAGAATVTLGAFSPQCRIKSSAVGAIMGNEA